MSTTTQENSDTYDVIIVGAGIAGFYVATQLKRKKPKLRVALADKYKFLGGRTFTYNADISGVHYQWEEGAARISDTHTLLLGLVRKYLLNLVPIGDKVQFKESGAYPFEPNYFEPSLPIFLEPLRKLPGRLLATTTIRKLLTQLHGERLTNAILNRYPYRAEMNIMRADMALALFAHEFKTQAGYSILAEGFSELIAKMRAEFEAAGGVILPHHELQRIEGERQAIFWKGKPSEGIGRQDVTVVADRIVLALPSLALEGIPNFDSWPTLNYLRMAPLLRIFGVFPKGSDGKVWFDTLPKFVSATPSRYIIPNSAANGSIQISYTDSSDAEPLIEFLEKRGEAELGKFIVADLRKLLAPEIQIPDPLFVKAHPWKDAVTYWLPGEYNPYEESQRACRPFPKDHPNWFVCGESYSTRQCWVEGALEHADMMLKELLDSF